MARVRLISGSQGLHGRYISSNAEFYDRIAFERIAESPPEVIRGCPRKATSKQKVKVNRQQKFLCPNCERSFASTQSVVQHRRDKHGYSGGFAKEPTVIRRATQSLAQSKIPRLTATIHRSKSPEKAKPPKPPDRYLISKAVGLLPPMPDPYRIRSKSVDDAPTWRPTAIENVKLQKLLPDDAFWMRKAIEFLGKQVASRPGAEGRDPVECLEKAILEVSDIKSWKHMICG